jgi:hypothetical protein
MGTETGDLKDCPSCGSSIAESAVKCSICKSGLGHCVGCNAWIVIGTECFDCGKSTAVRARKAAAAAPAEQELPKYHFEGSPFGLLPLLALRFLLFSAFAVAALHAISVSPFGKLTSIVIEKGVRPPNLGWPVLWGVSGGLLLAVGFAGTFVRRYRMNHTMLYGKAVEVSAGIGSLVLNLFITAIILVLTAGLGLPWLYARYRRSFYRSCRISGRDAARLDFRGSGEEVLGRFCLALLLLPFAIATGGLLLGVISWMWLKWEQSNVIVPDRNGQMRPLRFSGSFGAYYGRWALGWLITLVTAGIYRPWARISEWRWVAEHSDVA